MTFTNDIIKEFIYRVDPNIEYTRNELGKMLTKIYHEIKNPKPSKQKRKKPIPKKEIPKKEIPKKKIYVSESQKNKIKKMLSLASHPGTSDVESEHAKNIAEKLLKNNNLKIEDILKRYNKEDIEISQNYKRRWR